MSDIEKKAIELFNNKKFKDSFNLFAIILKSNPNSIKAHLFSAYCCIEFRNYELALKFLNELDKSIKIPEVFYYKGVCLNYLKQNDEAIKNYKKQYP